MKTWSAEELFVRAYSVGAVGVQAVLDAVTTVERITRPLGHDADEPLSDCEPVSPDGYYGYAELDLDESSAVVSRNEPAERPPEVDSFPPNPSGGPLTWVDWATPAICTVLDQHQPHPCIGTSELLNCGQHPGYYSDRQAWLEHVAPLIAVHLESALAHEFPASK